MKTRQITYKGTSYCLCWKLWQVLKQPGLRLPIQPCEKEVQPADNLAIENGSEVTASAEVECSADTDHVKPNSYLKESINTLKNDFHMEIQGNSGVISDTDLSSSYQKDSCIVSLETEPFLNDGGKETHGAEANDRRCMIKADNTDNIVSSAKNTADVDHDEKIEQELFGHVPEIGEKLDGLQENIKIQDSRETPGTFQNLNGYVSHASDMPLEIDMLKSADDTEDLEAMKTTDNEHIFLQCCSVNLSLANGIEHKVDNHEFDTVNKGTFNSVIDVEDTYLTCSEIESIHKATKEAVQNRVGARSIEVKDETEDTLWAVGSTTDFYSYEELNGTGSCLEADTKKNQELSSSCIKSEYGIDQLDNVPVKEPFDGLFFEERLVSGNHRANDYEVQKLSTEMNVNSFLNGMFYSDENTATLSNVVAKLKTHENKGETDKLEAGNNSYVSNLGSEEIDRREAQDSLKTFSNDPVINSFIDIDSGTVCIGTSSETHKETSIECQFECENSYSLHPTSAEDFVSEHTVIDFSGLASVTADSCFNVDPVFNTGNVDNNVCYDFDGYSSQENTKNSGTDNAEAAAILEHSQLQNDSLSLNTHKYESILNSDSKGKTSPNSVAKDELGNSVFSAKGSDLENSNPCISGIPVHENSEFEQNNTVPIMLAVLEHENDLEDHYTEVKYGISESISKQETDAHNHFIKHIEDKNPFRFYGCFTPYGAKCRPQVYGFRGPLHGWNDEEGQLTLVYNDRVTTLSSRARQIPFTEGDLHQVYIPKTCCKH